MKTSSLLLIAPLALALPFATVDQAAAKGCIKGAIVGGIAGHLAGHGGVGAAAGCAIGHHEANKNQANYQNNSNTQQNRSGVANTNTGAR